MSSRPVDARMVKGMSSPQQQEQAHNGFRHDLLSSIVVFLVALPLCLGIAVACGVPPALGLISGIIGGIVVGSLSGSPLQVSGPAAGLTVLVYEIVQRHGLGVLGAVVLLAGVIQLAAGALKLGRWFRAIAPAVIHGMLAGIGVLLCVSQLHVMFDSKPQGSGLPNLLTIPREIWQAIGMTGGSGHLWAGAIGILTLITLLLWKRFRLDMYSRIPAALPGIAVATLVAQVFHLPIHTISLPTNLITAIQWPTLDSLGALIEAPILLSALTLALIASAETLLSATAVDQMHHGKRADYNKELRSQGIGNILCGLVGALPMTGVIARSTVNVQAGARTRRSTILHGLWILLAVAAAPFVLELIPVASLAALLVYTGFKLIDLKVLRKLRAYGRTQVLIYGVTVAVIVAADLLTGVLVGFVLALIKLVLTMSDLNAGLREDTTTKELVLELKGSATFLSLPKLAEAIEAIPAGATVRIEFEDLVYIDHACLEMLESWEKRHLKGGGTVKADRRALIDHYSSPADKP